MLNPRSIIAIAALVVFSLLIVLSVGSLGDFFGSGGDDIAGPLPEDGDVQPSADAEPTVPEDVRLWGVVEDLPQNIAVFRTVFWEPQDTVSLRELIRATPLVKDKTVLEIGTGSGLIALCCLEAGAAKVVATDINPQAVANAKYNAELLGVDDRLDVRQVSEDDSGAYAVIGETERFDLVISNPPWEDATPNTIGEYALYDTDFALLRSLLGGLRDHLNPDGKALLAYGCVTAIETIQSLAGEYDLEVELLDERPLDSLPEVFLPGMLLSVKPRVFGDSPKGDTAENQ